MELCKQGGITIAPARNEDVAALKRLIEYAVEEAQRSDQPVCAQILAAARALLEQSDESLARAYAHATMPRGGQLLS